jgi:PAS domain S-box-containing protein
MNRLERQNLNSESSLRAFKVLWQNGLVGVALVNEEGQFISANPAFCAFTEYSENELRTRRWQDITHPEDVTPDEHSAEEVMRGERDGYDMKKRYITKMGRIIWTVLRMTAVPKEDGSFECFLVQISTILELAPPTLPNGYKKASMPSAGKLMMMFLKEYWMQFTVLSGAFAYVIAQVLKNLSTTGTGVGK